MNQNVTYLLPKTPLTSGEKENSFPMLLIDLPVFLFACFCTLYSIYKILDNLCKKRERPRVSPQDKHPDVKSGNAMESMNEITHAV